MPHKMQNGQLVGIQLKMSELLLLLFFQLVQWVNVRVVLVVQNGN